MIAPYVGQQFLARSHLAGRPQQIEQQSHLQRAEVDLLIVDEHPMGGLVDGEIAQAPDTADLGPRFRSGRFTGLEHRFARAQTGLHTQGQLAQTEGLGNIVVGAYLEAHDPVHLVGPRGQDDDARLSPIRGIAQMPADFDARHIGKHQIEQNQIRSKAFEGYERARAAVGDEDVVALGTQGKGERAAEVRLVLDDQHPVLAWRMHVHRIGVFTSSVAIV